ncbi:glycosyltransferase family 39 protein [Aureivirga sp. CE67]|uniref:glycosyltransferase family 39 protein n=1 Tax=Aureivirga sp. CE67 TaxID=1788983 RepID=UPI0018C8F9E9|nr:glycosyltransferase family 39 protein [Aureivirga sp. CE67]
MITPLKKTYLQVFLVIGIVFFFIINFNQNARLDDDYIGEQVYWLLKDGKVHSNLIGEFGNLGIDEYQSVFHKFLVYSGYGITKVFGWSLFTLHMNGLLYAILFLGIFYYYIKNKYKVKWNDTVLLLPFSVLLLTNEFQEFASSFRPEIMQMTIGFISFIFLDKYINTKKNLPFIFSAIFAGLAFLTHLNGVVYIGAATIYLFFFKREYIRAVIYGLISSAVFGLYFADILVYADIPYFIHQFSDDPSLAHSDFYWYSPLTKLIGEHERYYSEGFWLVFTVPLTLFIILTFKRLKKQNPFLVIYTFLAMILFGLYAYTKTTKYILLFYPMLLLLFTESFQILQKEENWKQKFSSIFVLICLVSSVGFMVQLTVSNIYKSKDWEAYGEKVESIIGSENKILSNGNLIFDQIKNQEKIININQFSFFRKVKGMEAYNFEELIENTKDRDYEYIVLDNQFKKAFDVKDSDLQETEDYEVIHNEDDMIILKYKK